MDPAFTAAKMYDLADNWINIANLDTDKRITLFEDTDKLADSLNKMKGSTAITVKERIAGLTENLLKAFNSHSEKEAMTAAHYIASSNPGARDHLRLLFASVMSASGKTADSPDLSIMACIDSESKPELNPQEKILALDLAQIEPGLLFDKDKVGLKLNNLLTLRDVSQASKISVDLILIAKLHTGEIDCQSLGLTSKEQVIDFFGEDNCKKITALQISDLIAGTGAIIGDEYVYELSGKELAQKLSQFFPNLISLKLDIDVELSRMPDVLKIKDLKLPGLKSCEIDCDYALDLDCVNNFPQLEFFKTNSVVKNEASLNCPNLRYLILKNGCLAGLNFLLSCPKLEVLFASCFENTDLAVLEILENLKEIVLYARGPHSSDAPYKEELDLSKKPKLVQINLENFPIKKLNVSESGLGFLSLDGMFELQTINLKNCTKLQEINLHHCPDVKDVEADNLSAVTDISLVSCGNIDAALLITCSNSLKKLLLWSCPKVKISEDAHFPALAELSINNITGINNININDVKSLVQRCPNLVTLYLQDIANLNLSLLESLPASLKKLTVHNWDWTFNESVQKVVKELKVVEKRGVEFKFQRNVFLSDSRLKQLLKPFTS